jgi:hypothetical protein
MGTLVVMRYASKLFLNLADHTYVKCGTGAKAWGCWGGRTGGTALRRGRASTRRADAIASPNERAGIKCYLINGVCHQAANRILLPAGITVMGARGYEVSESLYGPYGRPHGVLGTCASPFDQHAGISGDLQQCVEAASKKALRARREISAASAGERERERKYINGVLALYGKARPMLRSMAARTDSIPGVEEFHVELFMYKARYNLGAKLDKSLSGKLQDIRRSTERSRMKIEEWFTHGDMKAGEFAKAFNKETIVFQHAMAGALKKDHYKALLGLAPGDTVVLADPRIVKRVFGE